MVVGLVLLLPSCSGYLAEDAPEEARGFVSETYELVVDAERHVRVDIEGFFWFETEVRRAKAGMTAMTGEIRYTMKAASLSLDRETSKGPTEHDLMLFAARDSAACQSGQMLRQSGALFCALTLMEIRPGSLDPGEESLVRSKGYTIRVGEYPVELADEAMAVWLDPDQSFLAAVIRSPRLITGNPQASLDQACADSPALIFWTERDNRDEICEGFFD